MAFVSKKPLKKEIQTQLNRQLVSSIVSLRTESGGAHFISELLTDTEQIMLAKRLMMIFMLIENVSQYHIRQVLNVSSSTVARTARVLDGGGFDHITHICHRKKNRDILWKDLEVIVRLGMPSMGKDRWDWLNKLYK